MAAGYNININFTGAEAPVGGVPPGAGSLPPPPGNNSSSVFLNNILVRLTASIDKLNTVLNQRTATSGGGGLGGSGSGGVPPTGGPADDAWQKIGRSIGLGLTAVFAGTAYKFLSAQTTAIMAQASAQGSFHSAGILGTALQNYPGYVGSLYDIQRQKQISNISAAGGGAGGAVGIAAGVGLSFLFPELSALGLIGGAAAIGAAGGNYLAAYFPNSRIEERMRSRQGFAEREAAASTSEWQTGFARFGLARSQRQIAESAFSDPVNVHLSDAFEKKYGRTKNGFIDPYYNDILNGIVPYLQTQPLSESRTGDLRQVSQNFLQAGFSVAEFGRLTMMSSQYMALTGKNIQQFSEDLKTARTKFGNAFSIGNEQTSLSLMAMGYSQSEAQSLAFQSNYNPGIANSISQFTSMGPGQYYATQALGPALGFDLFNTLRTGQFKGSRSARAKLREGISNYMAGKGLSPELAALTSQGYSEAEISQWLQPSVQTAQTKSVASSMADAIKNALTKIDTVTIQAANVVLQSPKGFFEREKQGIMHHFSPSPHASPGGQAPIKK